MLMVVYVNSTSKTLKYYTVVSIIGVNLKCSTSIAIAHVIKGL